MCQAEHRRLHEIGYYSPELTAPAAVEESAASTPRLAP